MRQATHCSLGVALVLVCLPFSLLPCRPFHLQILFGLVQLSSDVIYIFFGPYCLYFQHSSPTGTLQNCVAVESFSTACGVTTAWALNSEYVIMQYY